MSPAKSAAKKAAAAKKAPMSQEHKDALAKGREESRAVRRYLEALEATRPRRGRRRTTESVKTRLDSVIKELESGAVDPLHRLTLLQEKADLEQELESMEATVNIEELEEAFIKAAKGYSDRQGIAYGTWRACGVDPQVLKRAGIERSTTSAAA